MSSDRCRIGRAGVARIAVPFAVLALAGCRFTAAPQAPCPPLPTSTLPVAAAALPPVALHDHQVAGDGSERGTLVGGGESVCFHVRGARSGEPRPLVLLVPILAGGDGLMELVGDSLLARGYATAACARAGGALRAGQRGPDLDLLFARTVLHQRLLLRWLRHDARLAAPCFVLGISLGGMVAAVLAAQEPDLADVAICLSGGALGDLVPASSEPRVQSWRRWRRDGDGVGDDHLTWELSTGLHHEPLRFAPVVPTGRVFLVTADFDTVVPRWHQDLLWEAFGRPARLRVPLGHYSAALLLDGIVGAVADRFDARRMALAAAPR